MADLLIRASTEEELEAFLEPLWGIVSCTGGWVGRFDDDDLIGDLEVRLITYRASTEELQAIWERVRAGEKPAEAHRAVAGPSFQYRQMQRAFKPGTGGAPAPARERDVDRLGRLVAEEDPDVYVQHLPMGYLGPGKGSIWKLTSDDGHIAVEVRSEDGNCPLEMEADHPLNCSAVAHTFAEAATLLLQWLRTDRNPA